MFIATMLTNPSTPSLDRVAVESLRDAWGGGETQWLSPGEAAEFALDRIPENRWAVWEDLQSLSIDLVIQPAQGRKKKLLLADMDSTMIQQECIDELAELAGRGKEVKAITARAMNGEIDFEGALRQRIAVLSGLSETVVHAVISDRLSFTPGGAELLATMKSAGAYSALVSGGFTVFTDYVSRTLGFDEHRANQLEMSEGKLTGRPVMPIFGQAAKVNALAEITARLGISETDVIAVGDGANDLGMLARAGTGVALHAKPAVAAQCDVRINHGDLTGLLYIQGYSKAEFSHPRED